jgi:hypothetical protein
MSTFLVVIFSVLYAICGVVTITLTRNRVYAPKILAIVWPVVLILAAFVVLDDY